MQAGSSAGPASVEVAPLKKNRTQELQEEIVRRRQEVARRLDGHTWDEAVRRANRQTMFFYPGRVRKKS
jgi:hypothetical protein